MEILSGRKTNLVSPAGSSGGGAFPPGCLRALAAQEGGLSMMLWLLLLWLLLLLLLLTPSSHNNILLGEPASGGQCTCGGGSRTESPRDEPSVDGARARRQRPSPATPLPSPCFPGWGGELGVDRVASRQAWAELLHVVFIHERARKYVSQSAHRLKISTSRTQTPGGSRKNLVRTSYASSIPRAACTCVCVQHDTERGLCWSGWCLR